MKKILLISLILTGIFLQSCDERITPLSNNSGGGGVEPTVSKTDLISRKWGYNEIYYDIDTKKTVIFGAGKPANLTVEVDARPEDYYLFTKEGVLEVYSSTDKKTTKGTWKFLNSEAQVQLSYDGYVLVFDIVELTDKSLNILFTVNMANLAKESDGVKAIVLVAGFGGLITKDSKVVKYGEKFVAK
jgi:hypothetical protein